MSAVKKATVRESAMEFLEAHAGEEYKPRELADALKGTFPERFAKKEAKQLANEIYRDVPAWVKQQPQLRRSEDTPRRYWWESSVTVATKPPAVEQEKCSSEV